MVRWYGTCRDPTGSLAGDLDDAVFVRVGVRHGLAANDAAPFGPVHGGHLLEAGHFRIDEIVGKVDEEGLVPYGRPCAQDRMSQPEGGGLPDIDAGGI